MKRFLAVLMALTMLVSMFNVVAFATGEEVSPLGATTTVAGGVYANPAFADNITTTTASNENYTITTVDGVSMSVVPTLYGATNTSNIQFGYYNMGSMDWVQTGFIELTYTVTYSGSAEANDEFGFGVALKTYDSNNASQFTIGAGAWKIFPYESGASKDIKYIIEFTDTQTLIHRYIKNTDDDDWSYVDTVTSNYAPGDDYKKIASVIPYAQQFIRSNTANAKATMTNLSVREIYKNAELESLTESYDTLNDDFAEISYVVPENYDKAKLVIGGKTFKEFNSALDAAGAYMTSVDLSALPYAGALPVELIVTDNNGSVSTKTTTLNVSNPNDRELIAYTDFDGNQSNISILNNDHVKPNGKSGNAISVSNIIDCDTTKYAQIGNANNVLQTININNPDGYCYDIEFDLNMSGNGLVGTYVKPYFWNETSQNYISDWNGSDYGRYDMFIIKNKVINKYSAFELGKWNSMKITMDTSTDTLYVYNEGQLLDTAKDDINSMHLGASFVALAYRTYTKSFVESTNTDAATIQIDNVKFYRYLPGNKTGITSVAVDPVTKAISITADTALSQGNVTDTNVTLTVDGNARTATVALAEDGKTIIVTPSATSAIAGKDAVVTLAPAVIGYGVTVPVRYVAEYSNRKITVDEATSKVTASVDIIADAAGENAGIMYIAYYKNGNLAHVYKTDVTTTAAGLGTFTVNYTPEERVDYDTVKTFVWNSSNTPLLKVYSK